jgi:hypothetical protein
MEKLKRYKSYFKLDELRLSDLADNQGASPMSMIFQKERGEANGRETNNTRLWELNVLPEGHIDLVFLSKGTKIYPKDTEYHVADSDNNYKLTPNSSHTYIITIRILDVKEWLSTFPKGQEITKKDMVDILEVSEVEIDDQTPAAYWQGGMYNLQQVDASIYKKPIIAPKHWNKAKYHGNGNFLLSKIAQRVVNLYKFYAQQAAQMLNKKAKEYKWIK